MHNLRHYLPQILLVFFGINILGLWIIGAWQLQRLSALMNLPASTVDKQQVGNKSLSLINLSAEQTSQALAIEKLQTDLATISAQLDTVAKQKTTTKSNSQVARKTPSQPKEQTIYIGSGSSNKTAWTDLGSTQIELNTANYPGLRQVVFEATLSVIGGEVSARLRNKTTGHIITASEVTHNTSSSTQKLSGAFVLSNGSNNYVVQLRSSSGETANLHSSRLRLLYK